MREIDLLTDFLLAGPIAQGIVIVPVDLPWRIPAEKQSYAVIIMQLDRLFITEWRTVNRKQSLGHPFPDFIDSESDTNRHNYASMIRVINVNP